jgi:S-DNA-T family DNA segregation ATPase FtsK/SpoIIIE
MAVVTFLNGVQSTKIKLDNDLKLISASSRLLEQVLKEEKIDEPEILEQKNIESNLNSRLGQIYESEKNKMTKMEQKIQNENENEFDKKSVNKLVGDLFNALTYRSDHLGAISEIETQIGPTFLTVNIPFAKGSSLSPLQRAENDIARDLGVANVNIQNLKEEAGKIRVLIPRKDRQFPKLDLTHQNLELNNNYLNLQIGLNLNGERFYSSISNWPHALVAGSTGSGKTTFIRTLLTQLNSYGSHHSNVVIVDGKGETDYFGILSENMFNQNFPEPQLNINSALSVLEWLKDEEIPKRKALVLEYAKENSTRVDAKKLFIDSINENKKPLISPLVVVIDEFNELMIRGGQDKIRFTDAVTSLAQAARSVLVHLVLATQRPDRNVLPGVIKANLQARFAFRLLSPSDSVIVLNHGGAEKLLNHGDMLLQLNGQEDERLQAFWIE